MRPAWAQSCGCKSRRKLITANEVKRNCVRVTERGKEAWSISCEPMDKNRIEGAAEQGERARNREALVIKAGVMKRQGRKLYHTRALPSKRSTSRSARGFEMLDRLVTDLRGRHKLGITVEHGRQG